MKTFKAIVIDIYEKDQFLNRYSLNTESISIGRHPNCDIVLNNSDISRRHALITYKEAQWSISNLGVNGTTYKGQKIDRHNIRHNDEFQIGSFKLLVKKTVVDNPNNIEVIAKQDTDTIIEKKIINI